MDIVGGPDFTQDRLGVTDDGTGDLTLVRESATPNSATVTIGPGNAEPLELTYQ